jgi:hypothetical protein
MAKKKSGLVTFVKKANKLKSESKSFLSKNPPIVTDVFQYVLPAAGAYVATRLVGRASRTFLGAKFPKIAPFAAPLGSLVAFGAIWYAAHKVSYTKRYHNQLMIGSGIALIQSLVQSVMPGLGWLFDSQPVFLAPVGDGLKTVGDDMEVMDTEDLDAGLEDSPAAVTDEDFSDLQQGVFAN